jgi:hypothetical protein
LYSIATESSDVKTRNLVNSHLNRVRPKVPGAPSAIMELLPSYESISANVRKRKKANGAYFPEPTSFEEIDPDALRLFTTVNDEELFFEKILEPSPMIMFATETSLQILRETCMIACDGTVEVGFFKTNFSRKSSFGCHKSFVTILILIMNFIVF